jgi:hypothetical protein
MPCSPGSVCRKILPLATVGVVDPAVQHQFPGTTLDLCQGDLPQERDGVVIELPPAHWIEVKEQSAGIVVPTPPQVSGERPEPLLGGSDEAVERAGLAHDGCDLGGGLDQHPDLILPKDPGLDGLDDKNALQDASINERDPKERLVGIFARFAEVLKARMVPHLFDGNGAHLLGNKAGETFVKGETESADTLGAKSERRGQDQVRTIRFEQIRRADIGPEPFRKQSYQIHEGFGRLAAFSREIADFLKGQDVIGITLMCGLAHVLDSLID